MSVGNVTSSVRSPKVQRMDLVTQKIFSIRVTRVGNGKEHALQTVIITKRETLDISLHESVGPKLL